MNVNSEASVKDCRPDIQALIIYGFRRMNAARYVMLGIADAQRARHYLNELLPEITTAQQQPHGKVNRAVQIAFTADGLRAIGVDGDTLGSFSTEFQQGMAMGTMSRVLGDTGSSDPKTWEWGGPNTPPVHVMIALYAPSEDEVEELHDAQRKRWSGALTEIIFERGHRLPESKEHFNFHDGIDEPVMRESGEPTPRGQETIEPGEMLLAHLNGYGQPSRSPTTDAANDPGGLLSISVMYPDRHDLGRNGSYLVYRKLEQNVPQFWNFWRRQAKDTKETIYFASKAVGRWPSGAPMALTPDEDNPEFAEPLVNNDFLYLENDPHGYGCPIHSHIRRANPRDTIPIRPTLGLKEVSRHRILRRGFSYGPFLDYAKENKDGYLEQDDVRRGLHFLAFNADLLRQFIFLQQTWVNNAGFQGGINEKDPLVGDCDGTNVFTIQRHPARRRIANIPRFVDVRAGAFFFFPSIAAIRYLAWGGR